MKTLITLLAFTFLLIACNSNGEPDELIKIQKTDSTKIAKNNL